MNFICTLKCCSRVFKILENFEIIYYKLIVSFFFRLFSFYVM
jgi:hypothetical protein